MSAGLRLAMLGLAGLGLLALAHLGALDAAFQFDDYAVIVGNPAVHGPAAWWQSMPGIRPLLRLANALVWALSPTPRAFHAFNLAVHALNAGLVWALARHWLAAMAPALAPRDALAAGVALLAALHPATVETVAYASGGSVSLMASFYLGALLAHARGLRAGNPWLVHGLSPLLFALALAVRETAATLPAALLLVAWCGGRPMGEAWRSLRAHLAVLLLAALALLATPAYDTFFAASVQARPPGAQALAQLVALAHLLGPVLLGLQVNLDPDLAVPAGLDAAGLATAAGLAALAWLAVASRGRRPWLGFGLLWLGLHLLPTNSLLPRLDLANDRHLYLALPGASLVLVAGLAGAFRARVAVPMLAALALGLALASHARTAQFRSETTLWEATVAASPGKARPWANLGYARQLAGDAAGARHAFDCALALDPGHVRAAVNRSLLPPGPARPGPGWPPCPAGG